MRTGPPDPRPALRFSFDGAPVQGRAGDTVAAALLAAGHVAFSRAKGGAARGPFCLMGVCHDCLLVIDGAPSQRACLTKLRDGMEVVSQSAAAVPLAAAAPAAATVDSACDVLVAGAGPAGLAAALACGPGLAVRVIDERPEPGGQYYKQRSARAIDRQMRAGRSLIARVRDSGADITGGATVWAGFRTGAGALEIGVLTPRGAEVVTPRVLIAATGAYEAPLMVPGWTLPGVMTVGACQTLLRAYGAVPDGRILVAGNGPLGLQLAWELARAGAQVVALAEAAAPPWQGASAAWSALRAAPGLTATGLRMLAGLRRRGVPVLHGHVLTAIEGEDHARAAMLAGPGGALRIQADTVCLGYGFVPSDELPRLLGCAPAATPRGPGVQRDEWGQTSQPDVLVAGEAGGFGGAHVALAQGRLAGLRARALLGRPAASGIGARRSLARHRRFQDALWRLYAAPDPGLSLADEGTIVCRCEALTLGALRAAIGRHGLTELGMLKRATRAGMGRCQGRYCGAALAALLPAAAPFRGFGGQPPGFAPQAPLRPVPAGPLAAEAPEWRGHRRSALPDRPPPLAAPFATPESAATVIIGGGIAGLSAAWFLARAGHDVAVLDRGAPGAEASGGNAGSLHVQLLSFDFAAQAESLALRTLPLQRDAAALWDAIAPDLGGGLELRRTGGLMVAETEAELEQLRRKAAAEQAAGIGVQVIGPEALYRLEPLLRPGLAGAAHCAEEGKINPMLATQAMLDAARAAGARVLAHTEVQAIARGSAAFTVQTQRGPVRVGRVVNAAGAWAGAVAAMAGVRLPVFGAPLQMIVTEPAEPGLSSLLAHAGRHLTLKQAASGGFIIGGGWTAGLDPAHAHPRPLRQSLSGSLWTACRLLPALSRLHVVRSWAAMNIDIDGAPVLGEHPAMPGLFTAVGANGYTLGPLLGQITARLILHGEPGRDIAPFGAERFEGS